MSRFPVNARMCAPSTASAFCRQSSSRYSACRSSVLPEKAVRRLGSGWGASVSKIDAIISERFNHFVEEFLFGAGAIGLCRPVAPNGPGPVLVSLGPADDVHVQLSHDVADRADIDLFHAGRLLQGLGDTVGFECQKGLVEGR